MTPDIILQSRSTFEQATWLRAAVSLMMFAARAGNTRAALDPRIGYQAGEIDAAVFVRQIYDRTCYLLEAMATGRLEDAANRLDAFANDLRIVEQWRASAREQMVRLARELEVLDAALAAAEMAALDVRNDRHPSSDEAFDTDAYAVALDWQNGEAELTGMNAYQLSDLAPQLVKLHQAHWELDRDAARAFLLAGLSVQYAPGLKLRPRLAVQRKDDEGGQRSE